MKILIVGTVGTGKTTLAKKLSKQYGINYWEIDSIVHDDNNKGKKRSIDEQNEIIKEIDKNKDWILEGVLRSNLYYLLDKAETIIYMNIPKIKRNIRITKRFIKQNLGLEKVNYKPNFKMLTLMFKWSNAFDMNKKEFEKELNKYKEKVKIISK